ncbi:MAG TPA: TraR/DksA C4-type zinc finger protein [Vicinamibacteria bacterium]|nr:TraR/DksA C4-type zinc finger protein [Vicinamibacteria bacterium]
MTENDAHLRYQALKEMMESRAQELHQGLRALLSGPADPVEVRDPEEWGRTSAEQDVDLTLMEMQADTCRRIDEALQRLEKGTYGRCEECDEEIPPARLQALPFATLCLTCQELQEEGPTFERRTLPIVWIDSPTQ